MRVGRFRWGALALCLLLVALAPGIADAATWTPHKLGGEAAEAQLFGISCPTSSLCVAVGGDNTIASSTEPAGPALWRSVHADEGVVAGSPNQRQLKGISCPSAGLCVAVSFLGKILTTTEPTGPGSAWSVADFDPSGPNTHFYGVSCPSVGFCVAVAGGGTIAVSTNPTGGTAAWTVTHLAAPLELRAVSCASPSFCVAVGDSGTGIRPAASNLAEVVSSTAPLAGIWQQAELGGAHGGLFGVACPSTTLCVAGDMFGNVVGSASPAGPASAWASFNAGPSVQVTGASCGSPTQCLLTDNNGDALTSSDPLAGSVAWTTQNLIPYVEPLIHNGLFSASCPTPSFCAIGATGEVLTSTDPSTPPPSVTPPKSGGKSTGKGKGKGKKRHKARPKRPRVVLSAVPPPEIFRPRGKAFLQFRFHVRRGIQVRGYVCSFDGGKMHRCRSPQRFRVGAGHHVFAVRAVGWTGLWGRPARAPVQVCRHSVVPSECLAHLPPPVSARRTSRQLVEATAEDRRDGRDARDGQRDPAISRRPWQAVAAAKWPGYGETARIREGDAGNVTAM